MKTGDLVHRTRHSHHKIGVVLRTSSTRLPSFYIYWFDLDPSEERHGWFSRGELEVVDESR
jgi:hypothetical protein